MDNNLIDFKKSESFSDLHDKKRDLYIKRQTRKISGNWSERDEMEYEKNILEFNEQIKNIIKKEAENSPLKAKIEAEINEKMSKIREIIDVKKIK